MRYAGDSFSTYERDGVRAVPSPKRHQTRKPTNFNLENMGIDIGTAFRAFLAQAVVRRGMPFEMIEPRDPNGFSAQHVKRLMRAKAQIEAGRGKEHALIEAE